MPRTNGQRTRIRAREDVDRLQPGVGPVGKQRIANIGFRALAVAAVKLDVGTKPAVAFRNLGRERHAIGNLGLAANADTIVAIATRVAFERGLSEPV